MLAPYVSIDFYFIVIVDFRILVIEKIAAYISHISM